MINLKLIKCDFLLNFILLLLFLKEIIKNVFLYGILTFFFFFFKLEREKDMIHEKFKKTETCSKKCYYSQQQLESHFWLGKC